MSSISQVTPGLLPYIPEGNTVQPGSRPASAGALTWDRLDKEAGGSENTSAALALETPRSMSPDDLLLMLQNIKARLSTEALKGAQEAVQSSGNEAKAQQHARLEKLSEAAEKLMEANKAGDLGKTFAWLSAAAAWIATALVTITATTAVVVGISAGTLGTGTAVALAVGAAVAASVAAGMGAALGTATAIVTSIPEAVKEMGPKNQAVFMGVMISLQMLASMISIGAGLASGGASVLGSGVSATTNAVTTATTMATRVADVAKTVNQAAQVAKQLVELGKGVGLVGEGARTIYVGVKQQEADLAQAEAAEFKKLLVLLQTQQESETEFVRQLTEMLDQSATIVAQVSSDVARANRTIAANQPA